MSMQFGKLLALLLMACTACQLLTPLDQRLLADEDKVRESALEKLADLPTEKRLKLVPLLLPGLKSDDSRMANRAADGLVAVGEPAVAPLIDSAQTGDLYTRLVAIDALGRLAYTAQAALPALVETLKDPHPLIRESAARAIGQIGVSSLKIVEALKEVYASDRVDTVKAAANEALLNLGMANSSPSA